MRRGRVAPCLAAALLLAASTAGAAPLGPTQHPASSPAASQPGSVEPRTAGSQAKADPPVQPAPEPSPPRLAGFELAAGADLLGASAFVWRGQVLCDSAVAQPNLWIRVGNLTLSSWVNAARHGPNGQSFTEHDLTIDYSAPFAGWLLSAGWINYTFADLGEGRYTNELYAAVSREGLLSPTITVYQDVHQGSGTYASLAVSHSVAVGSRGWSIDPMASVGYNHRQWTTVSGWSDAVVEIDVSIPLAGLTVQPFGAYSWSLDRRLSVSRFSWGIGASYEWPRSARAIIASSAKAAPPRIP